MNAQAIDGLRARYSDLNTDTLLDMWSSEARTEWAEKLLREELEGRGISLTELDAVVAHRDEIGKDVPPTTRDTIAFFGFVGRILAICGAVLAYIIANWLFGMRTGLFASAIAFAVYVFVLVRRVSYQMQFRVSGWASFAMIWQSGEAILILIGLTLLAFEV